MTPIAANSSSDFPRNKCLRMFTAQCAAVTSGIATWSLLPSGNRASTNGCERSSRRPPHISKRSTNSRTSSLLMTRLVSSLTPARATKIRCGELIQSSSTVGSLISSAIFPNSEVWELVMCVEKQARADPQGRSTGYWAIRL